MFEGRVQAISVLDAIPAFRPYQPTLRHCAPPPAAPDEENAEDLACDQTILAAKADWEGERAALLALIAAAEALKPEPSEELTALIAETVMNLVTEIVGEITIDSHRLVDRAKRAATQIGECDNARVLFAHPLDVPLLAEAHLSLTIMPDASAEQGSIRIDCSPGWIEHGTSIYLDALRNELGLTERPS